MVLFLVVLWYILWYAQSYDVMMYHGIVSCTIVVAACLNDTSAIFK